MKFKTVLLICMLLFGLVGCQKNVSTSTPGVPSTSDQTLVKLAQALHGVADSNDKLAAFVRSQNAAGNIPTPDAAPIVGLTTKLAQAVDKADAITLAYSQLTPAQRGNVLSVVQAVLPQVSDALTSGLAGIKNAGSLATVKNILADIQAGLTTAQAVLAATAN